MTQYKVEHHFSYGWGDADWTATGKPWRFASVEEAQQEIDKFVSSMTADDPYHKDDYRVVEVISDSEAIDVIAGFLWGDFDPDEQWSSDELDFVAQIVLEVRPDIAAKIQEAAS